MSREEAIYFAHTLLDMAATRNGSYRTQDVQRADVLAILDEQQSKLEQRHRWK